MDNLSTGQPRYDSDPGDNCGYMPVTSDFQWKAKPCGVKMGFICEKNGKFCLHICERMVSFYCLFVRKMVVFDLLYICEKNGCL